MLFFVCGCGKKRGKGPLTRHCAGSFQDQISRNLLFTKGGVNYVDQNMKPDGPDGAKYGAITE